MPDEEYSLRHEAEFGEYDGENAEEDFKNSEPIRMMARQEEPAP
jgi:hypothetical protein